MALNIVVMFPGKALCPPSLLKGITCANRKKIWSWFSEFFEDFYEGPLERIGLIQSGKS